MSEEYVPDEVDLRDAWVNKMIESEDWPIETGIFYAEKALAQIKVDALREAAYEFAEGAWSDEFLADRVEDDVSAVQCMYRWFERRAKQIEENNND